MRKRLLVGCKKRGRSVIMPPTLGYRSNSSRKGSRSRLLLRPWLEDLLDSEECQVLRWVDKHRQIFSIDWRHASSNGFDPLTHGDLFKRWAKHTGKLEKNIPTNHTSNKSTFRCALNSLPDCIQLTKACDKKGEAAKRTYKFLEPDDPFCENRRNERRPKKCKIQPKEETLTFPLQTIEVNTETLKIEIEQDTSPWGYLRTEVVSPAFDDLPSPSTAKFIILENATIYESTPPITSSSPMETTTSDSPLTKNDPCVPNLDLLLGPTPITNNKMLTQMQPNGVIALELQNLDSEEVITEQPVIQNNFLPTFSQHGVSEYETSIYLPQLNSGGSVKVQMNKPITLSQPEFVIDPELLQALINQGPSKMDGASLDYNQSHLTFPDTDYDFDLIDFNIIIGEENADV